MDHGACRRLRTRTWRQLAEGPRKLTLGSFALRFEVCWRVSRWFSKLADVVKARASMQRCRSRPA